MCSDEFAPLARAESQVLGLSTLPLIVIPHPLAGNNAQLVAAKASEIANEVAFALRATPNQLADRYREKFLQPTERRLAGGEYCIDTSCRIDPAIAD